MVEKINLNFDDSDFIKIEKKLGISFKDWIHEDLRNISIPEIDIQLEDTGIEVDFDQIQIIQKGLFSYKGHHVVIYIKDTGHSKELLDNTPEESMKYHLVDCKTINDMKEKNRYQRYVATNRKDGLFNVDTREKDGNQLNTNAYLRVCKNCLKQIEWANYHFATSEDAKNKIRDNFNLDKFFENFQTVFSEIPKENEYGKVTSGYASNHENISVQFKDSKKWVCETCNVNLSNNRHLLDLHHENCVKNDNTPSNLKALCKICHKKEPNHNHYYVKPKDRSQILNLRKNIKLDILKPIIKNYLNNFNDEDKINLKNNVNDTNNRNDFLDNTKKWFRLRYEEIGYTCEKTINENNYELFCTFEDLIDSKKSLVTVVNPEIDIDINFVDNFINNLIDKEIDDGIIVLYKKITKELNEYSKEFENIKIYDYIMVKQYFSNKA